MDCLPDEPRLQTICNWMIFIKKIFYINALSVQWDYIGIVYFELLPRCTFKQLIKQNNIIKKKRPELPNRKSIVFYHDNAQIPKHDIFAHSLKGILEVVSEAPFCSLQNFLNVKNFNYDLKNGIIKLSAKDGGKRSLNKMNNMLLIYM